MKSRSEDGSMRKMHDGEPSRRVKVLLADDQRMFREGQHYQWTMGAVVESPEVAMAEWTFSYVVSDAVPRSSGRKIRFTGMSVFELEGGRVAR